MVELQHYVELEDMVHMAIKIENQVKRKGSSNTCSAPSPSSSTERPLAQFPPFGTFLMRGLSTRHLPPRLS